MRNTKKLIVGMLLAAAIFVSIDKLFHIDYATLGLFGRLSMCLTLISAILQNHLGKRLKPASHDYEVEIIDTFNITRSTAVEKLYFATVCYLYISFGIPLGMLVVALTQTAK